VVQAGCVCWCADRLHETLRKAQGGCGLITGCPGMSLDLLRSHIGNSARGSLRTPGKLGRALCQGCQAKVGQQHFLLSAHEQILRLDVPVDDLVLMSVLQGSGHLLHSSHKQG
jgi:hypothetical protein